MSTISSAEAKYIAITYLIGFVTICMDENCDFYEEIPRNYILDEKKLESSMLEHLGIVKKEYYPNNNDIKVITKEFGKIFKLLLREKNKAENNYRRLKHIEK